jgi:hypothetical protein
VDNALSQTKVKKNFAISIFFRTFVLLMMKCSNHPKPKTLYVMSTQTQTTAANEIMHYPFSTEALRLKFNKVLKALDELKDKDSLSNLKNFEAVLDNTLKRSKLVFQASEIADKQLKREQLAKAVGLSVPMIKKYVYLAEAEAKAEAEAVAKFKALNKERLDKGLKVNYGIDAITLHLKGEKVYLSDEELQAKKDEAENTRTKKQAEAKAQTKPKAEPSPEAEVVAKPNEANYIFNPVLFGFENDAKEDIVLNIVHSPKNKAKPYLITSNVPSFVLRSMFETILKNLSKCEADLETIKEYEADLSDEAEIEDADYTTFDSDHIRIAR